MTRSKVELATILVKLRGSDEDPVELAKEMSLMKLCYEIQKVEEGREEAEAAKEAEPDAEEPSKEEVQEVPAAEKLTTEEQ